MPLTQGSVTIKLAGGDYSTWTAFWDDLGNLTGDITCTVDASVFTEASGPALITENLAGYTLHVLPVSFPTTTDASTGARFTFNTTDYILYMSMEGPGDLIIEGMVLIEGTSTPIRGISAFAISTEFNFTIRRNIVKGGGRCIDINDSTLSAGLKIYNNILYNSTFTVLNIANGATGVIANNTCMGGTSCVAGNSLGAVTFENILAYDPGESGFVSIQFNANGYNTASSDATNEDGDWGGTGSNNLSSIADPFNNFGADDFTITAEGAIGSAGLDLSGDFTDDFFGVTRSNWTIGACEFVTLQHITEPVNALIEVEATILGVWALTRAVSVLVEVEVDITAIKARIEAVSALIEVEADITELKEYVRSYGGTLTPSATLNVLVTPLPFPGGLTFAGSVVPIPTYVVGLSGELVLAGSVELANPSWLLIDDTLTWQGEWDEARSYELNDAVLYKRSDGNEWHVFVSKITHNVGNTPTSSAGAWRRYYQELWL